MFCVINQYSEKKVKFVLLRIHPNSHHNFLRSSKKVFLFYCLSFRSETNKSLINFSLKSFH